MSKQFVFMGAGGLAFTVLVLALIVVTPALAQIATSTSTTTPSDDVSSTLSASDTVGTPSVDPATTSDISATTSAGSAPAAVESPAIETSTSTTTGIAEAPVSTSPEPAPEGLTEVHIIGIKYTDYFTDGTTVTAYPGDPAIDSHFAEKDAPIPHREGLTWLHTTGTYLYDTPSGDLEEGQYAVQPNGSYIRTPFISSTSTPAASPEVQVATSTVAATSTVTTQIQNATTSVDSSTTEDAAPSTDPSTSSTGTTSIQ